MLITLLVETGLRVKKEALPPQMAGRVPRLGTSVHPYTRFQECSRVTTRMADNVLPQCSSALARTVWSGDVTLRPFVFPSPVNPQVHFVDYKTAWRTAAKKAGLADRRIYDLRATFASRANMCHATELTVAHLLGHASTQILPTYVRPLDENTRALIEAMNAARKKQQMAPRSIN
jgi:integrase